MQKKKFIITLLFAVLSIFMITACSDSSNESNSGVNNGGGGTVQPEPEPDNLTVKKFYNFDLNKSYLSTYALLSDGSLYTWGDNNYGQLGLGDKANRYYYPSENQKINIPDKINELIGLKDTGYDTSERTTFYKFSLYAITENGELYAWGDNSNGQLGIGNTDNQTKPVKVTGITGKIKQLITFQHYGKAFFDYFYVYAITEDGSLYAWGYNGEGLLGVGDKMDRNTPTKVNLPGMVKEIMHNSYSVYTILEDGSLYAWDYNTPTPTKINLPGKVINQIGNYAILEDGSLYSSVSINSTPTKVNLPGKVINLIGQFAILEDGSLYAWGINYNGHLGIGSGSENEYEYVNTPTKVNLPGTIKELITNGISFYAMLEDGSLYAWGYNFSGELGVGDEVNRNTPAKVNLPSKVKLITTKYDSVYAILEDSSLYAWGDNSNGHLGVGKDDNRIYTPEQVTGIDGVIKYINLVQNSSNSDAVVVHFLTEDGLLYGTGLNYSSSPKKIEFK